MAAPTRTTLLDAVNRIYACIGEQPLTSLTPPIPADAAMIVAVLNEVNLEAQSRGWHFNTDWNVTLTPDGSGFVAVDASWARVAISKAAYPGVDITTRVDPNDSVFKLYDKKNNTFVIQGKPIAEIVKLFDFEATPEVFRRYVEVRAARIFLDRAQGDVPHHNYTSADEVIAQRNLQEHEGIVDTMTVFDSYDAYRVIARPYPLAVGRW
jgi:hypothetical protein